MKVSIEYVNHEKCDFTKAKAVRVCKKTIDQIGFFEKITASVRISVAFISMAEIRKINACYRKKDKPTDVLSFAEYTSLKALPNVWTPEILLGEILVCCEYIVKSDTMKSRNKNHAISLRISHGVLHLAGFRHGKRMYALQEEASK